MPGTRPSALPISYNAPSSPKRQGSGLPPFTVEDTDMQRDSSRARKKHQKLVLWKSGTALVAAIFHSSAVFGWLAPKINFSDPPKRKGKSPESKRRAPILKIAYSDTAIPQIPVLLRSHWSFKISNFSKSIKPACVKTNTKHKTNWLFPPRVYIECLQKCLASRKERDLTKCTPCWQRREEGWNPLCF